LAERDGERQRRIERMRAHVAQYTWDATARKIHAEIEAVQREEAVNAANVERLYLPVRGRVVEALRGSTSDRATADIPLPSLAAQ
jgi:hypothetical protein